MRWWRAVRRLLKAAFAVLVIVSALIATQGNPAGTAAVLAGLLGIGAALWWRRQRTVAATVVALVLTCAITGYVTAWGAETAGRDIGPQIGVAFWIFAGVITIAAWTTRRHPGDRGITVLLANAALTAASVLTAVAPESAAVIGLIAGLLIVSWRSGGWLALQRWWWRRRPLAAPAAGGAPSYHGAIRDAAKTAAVVNDLTTMEILDARRAGHTGAVIEHVLIGRTSTLLLHTRAWAGRITKVEADTGETYAIDGNVDQLAERLRAIVTTNAAAQLRLNEDHLSLQSIVVFWDTTKLPEPVVELDVRPEHGSADDTVRIVLIRGEHLAAWLAEHEDAADRRITEPRVRVAARMLTPAT